jgi:hypothetical protein
VTGASALVGLSPGTITRQLAAMAAGHEPDNALVSGAMGLACDGFDHRAQESKTVVGISEADIGVDDRGNREWCPERQSMPRTSASRESSSTPT